jgi:hypothetical protein
MANTSFTFTSLGAPNENDDVPGSSLEVCSLAHISEKLTKMQRGLMFHTHVVWRSVPAAYLALAQTWMEAPCSASDQQFSEPETHEWLDLNILFSPLIEMAPTSGELVKRLPNKPPITPRKPGRQARLLSLFRTWIVQSSLSLAVLENRTLNFKLSTRVGQTPYRSLI